MLKTLSALIKNRTLAALRDLTAPVSVTGDTDVCAARIKRPDADFASATRRSHTVRPTGETTAVCLDCGMLQGVSEYETDVSFTLEDGSVVHVNGDWIRCFACGKLTEASTLQVHS